MNQPRLKSLVVENFRTLRGKVVLPLDAQVVLIHGTNGTGKTSVLSALELGLTGKIAHLSANGDAYKSYLTTLGTAGGTIALTTTAPHRERARTDGSVAFSDQSFRPAPLLDQHEARFFAERCYLPQATLGRLLEIYDDQKTSGTSPLTLFVKELLGLDPLDALVDGLAPAFNVARVRKIAPDYHRLEALKTSLQNQLNEVNGEIANATTGFLEQRARLNKMLAEISNGESAVVVTDATDFADLRKKIRAAHEDGRRLTALTRMRSELRGLLESWRALPPDDASRDQAGKEKADQAALQAFATWRSGAGIALDRAVGTIRALDSNVPPLDDDPEKSRVEALRRAELEQMRCDGLLKAHASAVERLTNLNAIVQRATGRIQELNTDLAGAVVDARSLTNALAGVVPHISGETCPICDRDFAELEAGPLSAHIAAKIASLTSDAGRLQALTTERAEQSRRLAVAQRDLLDVGNAQLSAEDLAEITVRRAKMSDLTQQLRDLEASATEGSRLMAHAASVRHALLLARRRDEQSVSMLPIIETAILSVLGPAAGNYAGIEAALGEALRVTQTKIADVERIVAIRIEALSELDGLVRYLEKIRSLRTDLERSIARMASIDNALKIVDASRDQAKKLSNAAEAVRSNIVQKVFSTSLNKVWRDLFVRLAPSEQFVPAFKLPLGTGGKVEATLETLHRSGKSSGSPGAILSQGNLNTAALTLFLALHLSVPVRMPWLILDDPVQSMDDVHIAQFAALLRTLSKGMNRQIVIAVHERALFDYLTLELSPAFLGDSLIAVEIARNFNGDSVATPRAFSFEEDRAIAA